MIILRILANAVIMAGEVAAVAALAAFAFYYPFVFAGVTAALSFVLGLRLEVARLRYELPFYFGGLVKRGTIFTVLVGSFEALFKGVLAGVAALFTFAGTNTDRLFWVAVLFGLCVYAGAAVLRLLSLRADALPLRWGYFRLAPPLGLLFSAGLALLTAMAVLPAANVTGIGWDIIFNTPAEPSIAQVSELFFQLKQAFDEFIVKALGVFMSEEWARLVGIVISVNVLSGFVSALYAAHHCRRRAQGRGRAAVSRAGPTPDRASLGRRPRHSTTRFSIRRPWRIGDRRPACGRRSTTSMRARAAAIAWRSSTRATIRCAARRPSTPTSSRAGSWNSSRASASSSRSTFESDDPVFAGVMTVTTTLQSGGGGHRGDDGVLRRA